MADTPDMEELYESTLGKILRERREKQQEQQYDQFVDRNRENGTESRGPA